MFVPGHEITVVVKGLLNFYSVLPI